MAIQTITHEPTVQLTLQPSVPILSTLRTIFEGVGNDFLKLFQDGLSVKLHKWNAEILRDSSLKDVTDPAAFIQLAKDRLRTLVFDITKDRFTEERLKEPALILETKWACERRLFDNCAHLKPLTLIPHLYAQAMLNFARSLIIPNDDALVVESDNGEPSPESLSSYRMMVQLEYAEYILECFENEAKEEPFVLEKLTKLIKEALAEQLHEAKKKADASSGQLKEEISQYKLETEEKVASLLDLVAELERLLLEAEKQREALSLASAQQQAAINALRQQLWLRIMEVENLKRMAQDKKPKCNLI